MNTFLPYPDFVESASCLDRARLGKQRVESLQILRTLLHGGGWKHHPAVLMWKGYEPALATYGIIVCREWMLRGYKDACADRIRAELSVDNVALPPWFGDEAFHASHRSNLLRKDATWYGKFGWTESADLEYVWPTILTK